MFLSVQCHSSLPAPWGRFEKGSLACSLALVTPAVLGTSALPLVISTQLLTIPGTLTEV